MAKQFTIFARFKADDQASKKIKKIGDAQDSLNQEVKKSEAAFAKGETSVKKYTSAIDKAEKEQRQINKSLKSTTDQTKKSSAGFSSLAKNVKASSVALAASFATIALGAKKAFDAIEEGAKRLGQKRTLEKTLESQGISLDRFIGKLNEVARSQISTAGLIESSSKALLLGIPADKIAALLEVARVSAIATGESVSKAFDDIATGVGRASPLILDNLGIIVKLGPTYERFAASVGKAVEELTAEEQKLALLNEVLEVGAKRTAAFGEAQSTLAGIIDSTKASISNWGDEIADAAASDIPLFIEGVRALKKDMDELTTSTDLQRGSIKQILGIQEEYQKALTLDQKAISLTALAQTGFVESLVQLATKGYKQVIEATIERGRVSFAEKDVVEELAASTHRLAAAHFEGGRALLDILGVGQQYLTHLNEREKALVLLGAAEVRYRSIIAGEKADLDALADSFDRLNVTLESEVNESINKNAEVLEKARAAAQQGIITYEDLSRVEQAIIADNIALQASIGNVVDRTNDATEATSRFSDTLDVHDRKVRADTNSVNSLAAANNSLAAAQDAAAASLQRFVSISTFTSAGGQTVGRVRFFGGSRVVRDDGKGGAFTPAEAQRIDGLGNIIPG